MNRSWPGHVDEADLASARERAPRVPEVDREAAALLLGPPVGVDPGEPHDQRRLAVVDVTGRRHDRCAAGHARAARHSILVVEVVAFQGVPGRAREVGDLLVGDRPQVEQHVVRLDAAEHAGATGAQTRGERRSGRDTRDAHAPRREPRCRASIRRPPTDSHRCTCACSRSPPIVSVRRWARRRTARPAPAACGRTGTSSRRRVDVHREHLLERRHLHLVDPHRARDRVAAQPRDERRRRPTMMPACGPPSSLSPENVTRSAPSASASATAGSSRGMPVAVSQQPRAHVVEERHAVPPRPARPARSVAARP